MTAIRLRQLTMPALQALAEGDLAGAEHASGIRLAPHFVDLDWRSTWRIRVQQVASDRRSAPWITRVIWSEKVQLGVGRAGFHGPPDSRGMVEIGYGVAPEFRRQGYARAALEALLDRAAREPEVRIVRATITPDNIASRRLIAQYGFIEVGEQCDDEDGLETIFEVDAADFRS